jgi:hypothetical protein
MKKYAIVLILLLTLVCLPASAYIANSSTVLESYVSTQFLNQNYLPYQYEILLIAMGFTCWVLMKYHQELETMYGMIAILIFGASAWFAAYMSMIDMVTLVDPADNTTTILYTQLVTPQPTLQVILIVCFLFAIIIEIYILFLRGADKSLDSQGLVGKTL